MLTIREEQESVFRRLAQAEFCRQLAAYILEEHGDDAGRRSFEEVRAQVAASVSRALAYGLAEKRSVAAFVTLTFVLGENFDRAPAIKAVLTDASVPPESRVAAVFERVAPHEWVPGGHSGPESDR